MCQVMRGLFCYLHTAHDIDESRARIRLLYILMMGVLTLILRHDYKAHSKSIDNLMLCIFHKRTWLLRHILTVSTHHTRQHDNKPRNGIIGLDIHVTVVCLNDRLDYGEPQSSTTTALPRRIGAIKTIEETR